ncbi:YtxH domain-containing protein [Atopococcus tabaci]|uniref:YtxH domain-containing protein n=1 Tax=Atopococcus tabaci TaxID=269774 RepID=UPI00240A321F|nr:YtxH domain-containing protein [Atopococcus tabaci]
MPKVSLSKTLLLSALSAGAALLFAPKSGKELRSDLKDEAVKMKDKGMDYADNLMADLKESYEEIDSEMAQENPDLARTIDEIEQDLYLDESETQDPVTDPDLTASAPIPSAGVTPEPVAVADTDTMDAPIPEEGPGESEDGNVRGTPAEPTEDQTIPADQLDKALADNYISDESDIATDDEQRAGNKGLWNQDQNQ